MKVKLGDMTVNQIIKVCSDNYNRYDKLCKDCPLFTESDGCMTYHTPDGIEYRRFNEKEINLTDEESS